MVQTFQYSIHTWAPYEIPKGAEAARTSRQLVWTLTLEGQSCNYSWRRSQLLREQPQLRATHDDLGNNNTRGGVL